METTSYQDRKTGVAGDQFLDDLADGEFYLSLTLGGCLLEFLGLRPHLRLASFLQEQWDSFRWYSAM